MLLSALRLPNMPLTTPSARITAEQTGTLGAVVKELTKLSHSKTRGLVDHGCVSVNGVVCSAIATPVQIDDLVEVRYDPQQGYPEKKKAWTDRTFEIVHEDEHLIVVNKSAETLTVATDRDERNTLEKRLTHYFKQSGHNRKAFVLQRLDRGVSGLLVFAKSPRILAELQEQFKQHKPARIYTAIVAGVMNSAEGTFRSYLKTDKSLNQFSTRQADSGELAVTHYRVLEQLADTTVVEVRLETGRRNQIRVHFADQGHPVLGDSRYNPQHARHPRWKYRRLALHATSLSFVHPATNELLQFQTDLPREMQKFLGRKAT
jgi:23S rRNA pseudouridine1911/1915/1917 synthase